MSGYVILEGNIGVGKSTFAEALTRAFIRAGERAEYMPEPNEKTNPFLADYYADPRGNAYKMQMHLLHQRYKATRYAQAAAKFGKGWFIMDRSYFGDLCFAEVQIHDGYFTQAEFDSYLDAHRNMRENIEYPTAAIFLRAYPETCLKRIAQRARACEAGVPIEYLKALDDAIKRLRYQCEKRCPVLSLDWNEPKSSAEIDAEADKIVRILLSQAEMRDRSPWDF